MTGRKGMKSYPVDVKLEVVRLFYEEGKTRAEIMQALSLRRVRPVETWVRLYRQEGKLAFTHSRGRPWKVQNESTRIKQLKMENALPKKYHTELRKSLLAKCNIGSSSIIGENKK
jgi:transposase-like protein